MLLYLPVVRKMKNHKAYLKQKTSGGWEIKTFAALRNWTALRLCQDRVQFCSVDESNFADMNALVVLNDFVHAFKVGEQ